METLYKSYTCNWVNNIDGLVQERRNSIANELELHLSCTSPLIYVYCHYEIWFNYDLLYSIWFFIAQ